MTRARATSHRPSRRQVTRYEGGTGASGSGCAGCAYDPLGNPLAVTDPRGFTTRFDRNELGEAYRTIAPEPYNFRVESYFDANRNTVRVDTEDRQPEYDSADPTSARFAQFTPSGSGHTAHVAMKAGPGGSVRPGWFTDLFTFDLLDNKIQDDIDATGSTPANLVTKYFQDPNQNVIGILKPMGNMVEFDFDERNFKMAIRVGAYLPSPSGRGAGGEGSPIVPADAAVTIIARDGNGNVVQVISPLTNGAATGNEQTATIEDAFRGGATITYTGVFALENTLDGFDRVIRAMDAVGGYVDTGAGYEGTNPMLDPDGRVIMANTYGTTGGATPTDRTPATTLLATAIACFDEGGRRYEFQRNVFTAGASGTNLPSSRTVTQDYSGGLQTNSTSPRSSGTQTLYPIPSSFSDLSYVLTRNMFDPGGRTTSVLPDNAQPITLTYDGANRETGMSDVLGNSVANTFDAAGNLVFSKRAEKCTISGVDTIEYFRSAAYYDCLNRIVLQAMQGADGNLNPNVMGQAASVSFWDMSPWNVASSTLISCRAYDSRSNPVLSIDPKGNSAVTVFDGASRRIQFQQHMRWRGQGRNPPAHNQTLLPASAGTIVTTLVLDGNGRVALLIDDCGSATRFEFDTLDRETFMIFQDGSTRQNQYDLASDVILYIDENGSQFANTFDALGRKTNVGITPGSGVSDATTSQAFQFDGLSRTTDAQNNGTAGLSDVQLFYDSIDRTLEDSQTFGGNTRNVTNTAFKSYPVSQFQFPDTTSGPGRLIDNIYDQLYRRQSIGNHGGATFAYYYFFGPSRTAWMERNIGLTVILTTWMNNAATNSAVQGGTPGVPNPAWGDNTTDRLGYDGAGRMIGKRHVNTASPDTSIVGFTTALDRASNKLYERALHAESRSSLYEPFDANQIPQGGYDSIDRLLQYQRGVLSSTGGCGGNGGGAVTTPITLSGADSQRSYNLDSLGNWRNTAFTPATTGTPTPQTEIRQHNGLNEITRRANPAAADPLIIPTYDANGNLTFDGMLAYQWDALNRMATANNGSTTVGAYFHDAFNRRIRKVLASGATTDFIYLGWRCFEDRNPAGGDGGTTDTPLLQYVWGIYLDELLEITTLASITTGSGDTAVTFPAGTYFPLQDLLYRTTATATIIDGVPTIVEAYDTDAYGKTLIFNAVGSGSNWWADDAQQVPSSLCQFIFTGQRYDAETGLYYYKRRYYSPLLGRFLSRDPAGGANRYRYAGGRPTVYTDHWGLAESPPDLKKLRSDLLDDLVGDKQKKGREGVGTCPSDKCSIFTIIIELPDTNDAYDPGHAGIGFPDNDTYFDWGPGRPYTLWEESQAVGDLLLGREGTRRPGVLWWSETQKSLKSLIKDIKDKKTAPGHDVLKIDVCAEKPTCEGAKKWWTDKLADPDPSKKYYSVPGVHCSSTVLASVSTKHDPKPYFSTTPSTLASEYIAKKYKHTCGSNKGKPVAAELVRRQDWDPTP